MRASNPLTINTLRRSDSMLDRIKGKSALEAKLILYSK
jgi:hypothetical protein